MRKQKGFFRGWRPGGENQISRGGYPYPQNLGGEV